MWQILSLALTLLPSPTANDAVKPGVRVPPLSHVSWLRDDPISEFREGQVYVVEFWSTSCAACVQSIESVNELARRHGKAVTFLAVHVWPTASAPNPADFLARRAAGGKPIFDFAIAEDVDGLTAKGWLDATQTTGLPTATIIDRAGRLAWFGHGKDVANPLGEVVAGTFDLSRSVESMTLKIKVGRLAADSSNAIEAGQYDEGIRVIMEALEADPDTVSEWIPSTYGHLLARSGSMAKAHAFARCVRAAAPAHRAEVMAGFANVILHFRPRELRDLAFALELAEEARKLDDAGDPALEELCSRLRAELDKDRPAGPK